MRRPIKAHLVNRPVYRSKPVTHAILNLDLNSNRPVNRSNRPVYQYEPIELSFLNLNLNFELGPVDRFDWFTGWFDRFTGRYDRFGNFYFFEFKFEFWIGAGLIPAQTVTGPDRFDR